jgi:hypothetical protein
MWRNNPSLYEINARVWLAELTQQYGRTVSLANVPSEEIERLLGYGLDGVWMMGVWAPSPASRRIALQHSGPGSEFRRALSDLREEDVIGSPFAVFDYSVSEQLGGDKGLRQFRERLAQGGLRLMLDFVPNHLAVDHSWTDSHPDYLVQCEGAGASSRHPKTGTGGNTDCFTRELSGARSLRFAHGRDPYFPPWTDTVQVNYNNPSARRAMIGLLRAVASRCDGVRCDMAMLVTNDVFGRVWGSRVTPDEPPAGEFWEAATAAVRDLHPGFVFLGEVYWDLERELQEQGFDYTYDKGLYDRLLADDAAGVREHLQENGGFQAHLARFIENHDEQRAVAAFGPKRSRAAAVLVATLPGLRLFHQGQFAGRRVKVPVQLRRCPLEGPDGELEGFYRRLLHTTSRELFHKGQWRCLQPRTAWPGNGSWRSIIAYTWRLAGAEAALVAVNLSEHRSQARIALTWPGWGGKSWLLRELLDQGSNPPSVYHRDGDTLLSEGLYVELEPFSYHLLSVEPVANG